MQETVAFIIARYDFFYSFIYCDIKKKMIVGFPKFDNSNTYEQCSPS